MTSATSPSRPFAIALSFPGEHRDYVEQVALALLPALGGEHGKARVFYDKWHEGKIIGYGSNRKLQQVYAHDSDLIVPFYCQDYLTKNWCGVELRAIEELLFNQQFERVLPFRFDMAEIPSSFPADLFPVVTERPPEDIARLILERYRQLHPTTLARPKSSDSQRISSFTADISRISRYALDVLIGRESDTQLLVAAWDKAVRGESQRPHVLTLVALGGEGKTSLVAKWAAGLAHQGWPGCEAAFAWTFYSQGSREQMAASSDLFLYHALTFFGDAEMAGSAQSAFDKGRRLAQLVGQRRALLILDGLEPLQYPARPPMHGKLKDDGIAELLLGLAAQNRGLCVVTTRYSIPNLHAFHSNTAPEVTLSRLSTEAGVDLLQQLGVRKESGSQAEFEKAGRRRARPRADVELAGQLPARRARRRHPPPRPGEAGRGRHRGARRSRFPGDGCLLPHVIIDVPPKPGLTHHSKENDIDRRRTNCMSVGRSGADTHG